MKRAKRIWITVFLVIALLAVAAAALQLVAVRGTFAGSRSVSEARGEAVMVGAPGHRLAGRSFAGRAGIANPLIVVLHGDAPFSNPTYQYKFSIEAARALPNSTVVALLRPGYSDPYGAKSDGDRGFASGDNYTSPVVQDVTAAIRSLKASYGASSVVLVGHSGGAAIAADVAASSGTLIRTVILIGCPCNVPAFRQHMAHLQWSPIWLLPDSSLSPDQTLDKMDHAINIIAISGSKDVITLPEYSRAYVDNAQSRGNSASLIVVPDQGHEILNNAMVLDRVVAGAQVQQ